MLHSAVIGFAIAAVIGLGVGILSGMIGVGGGVILIPLFRLGYVLSPLAATATSLFTVVLTSFSGAASRIRSKSCVPAVGIAAGVGGMCTSSLGVYLANRSPAWCIMVAAALVIGYCAVSMFRRALSGKKPGQAQEPAIASSAEAQGPAATPPTQDTSAPLAFNAKSPKTIVQSALIGLLAGVLAGYVGVGGGFLMVPLFISLLGMPMKQASGTSLIAVVLIALPAAIEQLVLGNVNLTLGIAIALGSVPGAIVGSRLQKRVPERTLCLIFSCLLLVTAIMLVVNELGLMG